MAEYFPDPVVTDPDELAQAAFDYLSERVPGWAPANADIASIIIEAQARMVAELRDTASDQRLSIYKHFGRTLFGILPVSGAPAYAYTTWTMVDDEGYTIPEGTVVGLENDLGEKVAFTTVNEVTVPNGETSTDSGEVLIVATYDGADGNDLAGPPDLFDSLNFVTGISQVAPSSGGSDEEDDVTYVNRLTEELQLATPTPILPHEFAVMARRVPGVWRTVAIDLYDPSNNTYNNERMVSVAGLDESGVKITAPLKTQVKNYLESLREVNFIVNVFDPVEVGIDVTFTATSRPDYDPAEVETNAEAAITAYLDPAFWGRTDLTQVREWSLQTKVRYLEVAHVLDRILGLDYIDSLTIGLSGGTMGTSDIDLTNSGANAAPIPDLVTLTGTVNAP